LFHGREQTPPDETAGDFERFTRTENIMKTLITIAIFGALAASGSSMCMAADGSDAPQTVVKFEDLNLANSQGAAMLYSRISAAAHEVCKSFDIDGRDLGSRTRLDACVHKAIADAVIKVDQPRLFAIYNAKNYQHLPIMVAATQTR
jgi:UrcA family protein